jgi:hypothetical protein
MENRFKNFDWVHLEGSQAGALALEVNSRRTALYTASSRQL